MYATVPLRRVDNNNGDGESRAPHNFVKTGCRPHNDLGLHNSGGAGDTGEMSMGFVYVQNIGLGGGQLGYCFPSPTQEYPLSRTSRENTMTSFADTVRFCFPAAPYPTADLPLQSQPGSGQGGQDDLLKGTAKMTSATVMRSYAPDWVLAIVLWYVECLLFLEHAPSSQEFYRRSPNRGVLAILSRSPGHKREFSLTDTTIQHSFAEHERVPPWSVHSKNRAECLHLTLLSQVSCGDLHWNPNGCPCSPQRSCFEK